MKRFMWVHSPRSAVLHIKYGNTSEGPCKCGVQASKGWKITSRRTWKEVCKRCL